MKRLLAVLIFAVSCASVRPNPTVRGSVIARREVLYGPDDIRCLLTIEYTNSAGVLVQDEILVPREDFDRFHRSLEVCVYRTLDGPRLNNCPN